MPVDLDAPIYAVPCGVPGDLDALSGRAHICPDRTRIAVTECEVPDPTPCWWCELWGEDTPLYRWATVAGVATCMDTCFIHGLGSRRQSLTDGAINGRYRLVQRPHVPCVWTALIGHMDAWRWNVPDCEGEPVSSESNIPIFLDVRIEYIGGPYNPEIRGMIYAVPKVDGNLSGSFYHHEPIPAVSCLSLHQTVNTQTRCSGFWIGHSGLLTIEAV